jgi:hypothetical protein
MIPMLEYKVVESSKKDAAMNMNVMAALGWRLHSVTFWSNFTASLLLTFERERPDAGLR